MATIDKIAKQVASALKKAGMTRPATLIVVTRGEPTPGQRTAGANVTEISATARGLVVSWKRDRLGASEVQVGDRIVMLLGATIAGGAIPKPGDKVTIEGTTSRVMDVDRDPAGATYHCLTRK